MTDTVRAYSALITSFATNTSRAITEQNERDFITSVLGVVPLVAKTADYTATESDEFITVATSSADITITLPAVATTRVGKRYVIKKIDANAHDALINPNGSENLDGSSSSLHLTTQYWSVVIVSNGSQWLIESKYAP